MADEKFCEICKRTHNVKEFYSSNNLEKYPDGKLNICKKQITMNVDNWDPETFLGILQECDVPYIPKIWNNKLAQYGKDRSKVSGMTILGRYLSTMKIKPNDKWRWKDTQYLQELADHETEEAMKRQGYDAQEIDQVIREARKTVPDENQVFGIDLSNTADTTSLGTNGWEDQPTSDYFADISGGNEIEDGLTDEDRIYLRLKWGKAYKPEEWVKLEQLYNEMIESYDIQTAGHRDTLILVCKTSLKANQLLDIGDIDGAQKVTKMYDSLMKSGKFTAAQNKAESGEFVDSVCELIEMCEKQGYIERFYVEQPNDKVDLTILDMQRYTRTLVEEETNLSSMIEQAIKQNIKEDEESAANDESEIVEDLTIDDIERQITDQDFEDFNSFKEEQENEDQKLYNLLMEGEE